MDIEQLARQFGISEAEAQQAVDMLGPVVAAGFRRGTATDGLAPMLESLRQPGGGGAPGSAKEFGDAILSQIFGSKDVSRGVASELSASSDLGSSLLKKLLPVIAAMVFSQVVKSMTKSGGAPGGGNQGGGLGDILSDILGGGSARPSPEQNTGGIEDILKDILGGGETPQSRDKSPSPSLDDILGRGTARGNAADDLLDSVERAVKRRY